MSEREYICSFEGCSQNFTSYRYLSKHILNHEKPYLCQEPGCVKRYGNSSNLKRHVQESHKDDGKEENILSCTVNGCTTKLRRSRSLEKHIQFCHKTPIKCDVCQKTFTKRKQLKAHQFEHSGVKTYKCEEPGCTSVFSCASRLKRHKKIHEGYKCDETGCDHHAKTWSMLRKHKAEHHKKVYTCQYCDRPFSSKLTLKNHKPVHLDTRDAIFCSYEGCEKYFYFKKNLKTHIQVHHLEQKFICNVCQKPFTTKRAMARHIPKHDPCYRKQQKPMAKIQGMATMLSSVLDPERNKKNYGIKYEEIDKCISAAEGRPPSVENEMNTRESQSLNPQIIMDTNSNETYSKIKMLGLLNDEEPDETLRKEIRTDTVAMSKLVL